MKAIEGAGIIAQLNHQAAGRIKLMPGSGINESNVQELVSKTNVSEIHFSATRFRESEMHFKNPVIAGMGDDQGNEFKLRTVDPERVREMRRLIGNG